MYLKSLTLKGFKSFASSTTLQLEPGITCIVGPNGSGKSNVVDALAWVMGEQGAKTLRGGKMEDVIFAGTSGRPPLGRAEVLLTIDNADGALPIEYSEVTISRTMFRNGGSEYAINGTPCRLLDVQELLSDSGIGREMHVIVGQGQLDSILHATPEDRRGFIEEAAGVLKHRKRKEKALRKLDSHRRQPDPSAATCSARSAASSSRSGRQAEVARQAAVVQADARDARARLLADDLIVARTALEQELADETILVERREEVEAAIAAARRGRGGASRRRCARTCPRWRGPRRPGSRCPACASGCAARRHSPPSGSATPPAPSRRSLDSAATPTSSRPRPSASAPRSPRSSTEVDTHRTALETAVTARQYGRGGGTPRRTAASPACVRAAADRREGLARLPARSTPCKSRAAAADEELGRLGSPREAAAAARPSGRSTTSPLSRPGSPASTPARRASTPSTRRAVAVLDDLEERLAKTREEAAAGRARAHRSLAARKEALELGLNRKDGAGALLAATDSVSGLLGLGRRAAHRAARLRGRRRRRAGHRRRRGGRRATSTPPSRPSTHLKAEDLGRAGILLGGATGRRHAPGPACPDGATYAVDVVECPDDAAARRWPGCCSRSPSSTTSTRPARLVADLPDVTAVTRDGDLLGAHFASGGSSSQPSLIEVQAAVDEAADRARRGRAHACERLGFDLSRLESRAAGRPAAASTSRWPSCTSPTPRWPRWPRSSASTARRPAPPRPRPSGSPRRSPPPRRPATSDLAGLAELEQRLAAARGRPRRGARHRRARAARRRRPAPPGQAEMDARLALRTAEERARALHGRADSLLKAAQARARGPGPRRSPAASG